MHHAVGVRERHGVADLEEQLDPARERQPRRRLGDASPAHQRHDVEGPPVGRHAGVVHGDDAGVLQRREDAGLAGEPIAGLGISAVGVGDLHRHLARQCAVEGGVDHARAAVADRGPNLVSGAEVGHVSGGAQARDGGVVEGGHRRVPSRRLASASNSSSLPVAWRRRSSTRARSIRRIAARWLVTVVTVSPSPAATSA